MATARKSTARKPAATKKSNATARRIPVLPPRVDEPEAVVVAPAKGKRVHGKFAMPKADYALIDELKKLAKKNGQAVRKNELLRAGLRALRAMDALALRVAIAAVRPVDKPKADKASKKKKAG